MKHQWAIIGACFLFIFLGMSGCDQLMTKKPNHINVNIMADVHIIMLDTQNNIVNVSTDWMEVTVIITRNGADPNINSRYIQNGLCQVSAVEELAQGQYFECNATVKGPYGEFDPLTPGYAKLTWETVNASQNYGDVYMWYPHLTIQMKQRA